MHAASECTPFRDPCRFDVLAGLRPGGTVLINAPWKTFAEVEAAMPAKTKTRLAALRPKVGRRSLDVVMLMRRLSGMHTVHLYAHTQCAWQRLHCLGLCATGLCHNNSLPHPPSRRYLPPAQLYCLDAGAVAAEAGLGRRVNMVMQAAFFALSGVMDINEVRCWGRHCAMLCWVTWCAGFSAQSVGWPRRSLRHAVQNQERATPEMMQ